MNIPINLIEPDGVARMQEPVLVGLPLADGYLPPEASCVVLDENQRDFPSQFRILSRFSSGSPRAIHGVFLVDLGPHQKRELSITTRQLPAHVQLLSQIEGGFEVGTGDMSAQFNDRGELISLCLGGAELLNTKAGPSLLLNLGLGPAWWQPVNTQLKDWQLVARIKENGPVRAILNVSGKIVLRDRRGEVALRLDCDYVFYAGKSAIHVQPMLLGAVTEAVQINDWSFKLFLKNGKRMVYGCENPLIRDDPHDEQMSWRGLQQGWVNWVLPEENRLTVWSPDFMRHENGFVQTMADGEQRQTIQVSIGRVEPFWQYPDVSHPPKPITLNRGSWARWEAVFAIDRQSVDPAQRVASWRSPLRAHAAPGFYREALRPWLEGESHATQLWHKVADKCEAFICHEAEYAGSIYGGWDEPNQTFLERGVSRGDFGEYLFNEFYRSGDPRFYRMASEFGRIYRDRFCFTIEEASDGPHELGASRSRQSEHTACIVRSYRGAVLLAYMYHETGDDRYLDALRKRAAFHLENYPHYVGRVSMSTHDSAFMAAYLDMPQLLEKAVEVTQHSLDRHFDSEHGFFEAYDESKQLPDGRFPPRSVEGGYWFMNDFLATINASPEMTAYNIIGWYGLLRLHDPATEIRNKIKTVCEWFRDHQNTDGSWPYPHHNSKTRWGHGSLQDTLAMLFAFKLFGDESFLAAARRSITFTEQTLTKYGRLPLCMGTIPHEETEDSLTYYYGIEALAHYQEVAGNQRSEVRGQKSVGEERGE